MTNKPNEADVIVIGAGASGLMCAYNAAYRGLKVILLEKGAKVGLKILVSGGGRCNFTNLYADPRLHYLSQNQHFCISAMKRYEPADFIQMVEMAEIAYNEKKLGQLFCNDSAKQIVAMLVQQCDYAGVEIKLRKEVTTIDRLAEGGFSVGVGSESFTATNVVIACGGLSLPKIASDFAFKAANKLGMKVIPPRAALVPLTWSGADKEKFISLSGISVDVEVTVDQASFRENMLFTHRGLSGPAILQISSFWREGGVVIINLLPDTNAQVWLQENKERSPRQNISTLLKSVFANRLVDVMTDLWFADMKLGDLSASDMERIGAQLNAWQFKPGGSEGYRTAEVTLGGIDTDEVSSKTFAVKSIPGLYVIGEALDVTGWLGGYNFQWAWASGWCCAQHLEAS